MTCKEVSDFLGEYLDGTLPVWQQLVFKVHLLGCRDCRRYLASYQTTIKMAKSLGEPIDRDGVPPIPEELVKAILDVRGK
jgi:predicted anti-sigma-YlaC factor YlaD